jgi:hypothetical protein
MAGSFLGPHLGVLDDMAGQFGGVALGVVGGLAEQEGFGFVVGKSGDAGQFFAEIGSLAHLLGDVAFELGALILKMIRPLPQAFLVANQTFQLLVDKTFAVGDALLRLVDLQAPPRHVLLGLLAKLQDFLVGQEAGFPDEIVGLSSGVGEQLRGALVGFTAKTRALSSVVGHDQDRRGGE